MIVIPGNANERRQERVIIVDHDCDRIRRVVGITWPACIFIGTAASVVAGVFAAGARQPGYTVASRRTQGGSDVTSLAQVGNAIVKNKADTVAIGYGADGFFACSRNFILGAIASAGFGAHIRAVYAQGRFVLIGDCVTNCLAGHILDG